MERQKKENNTKNLVELIERSKRIKRFKTHNATKIFQALRIFVNKEISELINGLIIASKILKKDGFYQESWNSPEANQKRLKKLNERMSKNWVKYNPEYHIKRINPDTGVFFKPGDRDKDRRYFLNYYGGAQYD